MSLKWSLEPMLNTCTQRVSYDNKDQKLRVCKIQQNLMTHPNLTCKSLGSFKYKNEIGFKKLTQSKFKDKLGSNIIHHLTCPIYSSLTLLTIIIFLRDISFVMFY